MYCVYLYTKKIAARTRSKSLEAAAKDNLSDALVSIGTVVGIVGSQFQMPILDPIAALIVGLIICKTAWEIFVEASHMLTDGIDPDKMEEYADAIEHIGGVENIVDRARMYGNQTYVDITIEVDARMDVGESHCILTTSRLCFGKSLAFIMRTFMLNNRKRTYYDIGSFNERFMKYYA